MTRKQLQLVPFRASEDTIAGLKKLAASSGVSLSEYIRRLATKHVQRANGRAA